MSHGVNRGKIKSGKKDERENFIKDYWNLIKILNLIFMVTIAEILFGLKVFTKQYRDLYGSKFK